MARYIDAQNLNSYEFGLMSPKAQKLFHRIIDEAPTEEVQPIVHGMWINKNGIRTCSNCGAGIVSPYDSYCPNCGSFMKGEKDETFN